MKASNANIVRFQGDRLEPFYADIPGQWGGIIFTQNQPRQQHSLRRNQECHLRRSALQPRQLPRPPDLTLENTVIRNISGSNLSFANASASTGGGVISYSGDVAATNCLFTNCGEYAVLGVGGGTVQLQLLHVRQLHAGFPARNVVADLHQRVETATGITKRPLSAQPAQLHCVGLQPQHSIDDELFVKNYAEYTRAASIRNTLLRTKEYANQIAAVIGPGPQHANLLKRRPVVH